MGKKAKHPEHENLERWLVSYADFITLLFATFTALYAMAQTDVSKLKDISEAIREGFEQQSIMNGIQSILQGKNPPSRNPDPLSTEKGAGPGILGKFESMTYRPGEIKSLKHMSYELRRDLQELNREIETFNQHLASEKGKQGQTAGKGEGESAELPIRPIEASIQERGIRVSFDSRLLFPPGGAALTPEAFRFLDKVAERLKKFSSGNMIHVEGHTDSLGISTAIFPSNWELSCARASSVVRYFISRHDYNPQALVAVGYGDSQPLASNATPEGRAKNRRVDIVIYTQKVSALVNPRLQYLKEQTLMSHMESSPSADKKVEAVLPNTPKDGPVRVIIREKDGTEKILIPKSVASPEEKKPAKAPSKH
ncbi:MAG TPA: OmpA family protein [Oculatellaceae cyanobacterium]|jgi:chemotaxis protein MotB